MREKKVVLGLIQNSKNQLLICERLDEEVFDAHKKWDLPGGTVEPNETLRETLSREVIEEVGLIISVDTKVPHRLNKKWNTRNGELTIELHCFSCTFKEGIAKSLDPKIGEVRWVSPDSLSEYDFLETTQVFLEKYFLSEKL